MLWPSYSSTNTVNAMEQATKVDLWGRTLSSLYTFNPVSLFFVPLLSLCRLLVCICVTYAIATYVITGRFPIFANTLLSCRILKISGRFSHWLQKRTHGRRIFFHVWEWSKLRLLPKSQRGRSRKTKTVSIYFERFDCKNLHFSFNGFWSVSSDCSFCRSSCSWSQLANKHVWQFWP